MSIVLNKGQLKIQQMAFMLVAVTVFFILVFLFYVSVKTFNLQNDVLELRREKAVGLVTKIASTPEFNFEGIPRGIDMDKLMVLKNAREYKGFWGVKGIIVKKLYPVNNEVECNEGNYPNCNVIKLFTKKSNAPIGSYVALCRKDSVSGESYDRCEIGFLMIEVEEELE